MLDALIARAGLPAIFVGAGVEGEPFAIAGGLMAHQHLVPLWAAITAAVGGSWLIDQLWFLAGRSFRSFGRVRAMMGRPAFARCLSLLERYPKRFILIFRFAYGIRAVAPLAIGATRIPVHVFVPLSILAALVWGTSFTLIGFGFGRSLGRWLNLDAGALIVVGAALILGSIAILKYVSRPRPA